MKKRILALALAGTTAFSVFGAAMSASAVYSTHTANEYIDAYMSMKYVAKSIDVTTGNAASTVQEVEYYRDEGYGYTGTGYKDTTITATTDAYAETQAEKEAALVEFLKKIPVQDDFEEMVKVTKSGNTVYLSETRGIFAGGTWNKPGDTTYTLDHIAQNIFGLTKETHDGAPCYVVNGVHCTTIDELLTNIKAENSASVVYVASDGTGKEVTKTVYEGYEKDRETYKAKWITSKPRNNVTAAKEAFIYVNDTKAAHDTKGDTEDTKTGWQAWSFNSNMDGDLTIEAYTTKTQIVNGSALDVVTTPNATIYAFDFVPYNKIAASSVGTVATNWANKDVLATANAIGNSISYERGRGSQYAGIRYDVVGEWEDFLDELSINNDNGYAESWAEFLDSYQDIYYYDPYYDVDTGALKDYWKVDLYNLEQLLKDIYSYSSENAKTVGGVTTKGYYNANTSELIYLMQQYEKYFNDYAEKDTGSTSEWGELLLSILESATSDDFAKAAEYKKYVNRVEDLRDAYEEATTVNMIKEAEVGMYNLLTTGNASYKYKTAPSKSDLTSTLYGTYFNAYALPATYSTSASTSGNAAETNYEYQVATFTSNYATKQYNFTTTFGPGYYSLYPMADYIDYDYTSTNVAYNGNTGAADFVGVPATEEYEWFWNVYQLAVNMKSSSATKGNTKQGSIDAVDAALQEAIEALAPTTTPTATEVSALEEMVDEYDGKVESDYIAKYYNNYVAANNFAEVAEGKYQTRVARYIVGVAGEALTWQGTQNTITKNMIKEFKTAIAEGEKALEAIRNSTDRNAAQINALKEAINDAQDILDVYNGEASSSSKSVQSVNKAYSKLVADKDQIVISDLDNAMAAIDAAINYSDIVLGWSKNAANEWQYGTDDGYLNDGWKQIDKVWYYFDEDGTAKQSEWMQEDGKWYWFNSNCGAAIGWAKVDNQWYYFGGNNAMKTGWQKVDGNWYYLASSGRMVTGWVQVDGKWYYMSKESNSLGQMLSNTTVEGYKLGADGAMIEK